VYTEIDSTFNQGVRGDGAFWHRTQDRAGIAFVSNGIKKDHQIYLADGGLGFLLGDGGLNTGGRTSLKRITRRTSGEESILRRECSTLTILDITATGAGGGADAAGARGVLEQLSAISYQLSVKCTRT